MRGLIFDGVRAISHHADLPDPGIEAAGDAVVEVGHAGLCGSDLHPYEGREPARAGVIPGHEAVGRVVAVGGEVASVLPGDRVLVPFTTCCGRCPSCHRWLTARCDRGQLFGWGDPARLEDPPLQGAQAQFVRVPLADGTLLAIPDDLDAATALLLTDNLPTAWEAVARAAPAQGEPCIIVGLGSVGLCAVIAAANAGGSPVIGIDPVADRRQRALRVGADIVAAPDDRPDLPQAPAVVEAAGNSAAQHTAMDLVRAGGSLSIISVQTAPTFAFTPIEAYDRNLTVHAGRASVRHTLTFLLPRVARGEMTVPAGEIVTDIDVPLNRGAALYERFAARADGLVKAAFLP